MAESPEPAGKRANEKPGSHHCLLGLKRKIQGDLVERNYRTCILIFLRGSYELLLERMEARNDHFMPADLLPSQLNDLEIPAQCITVEISNSPAKIIETILSRIRE